MICENCGKQIEEGSIYCNYCGLAVQIVPNYNLLDEDILPEILEDPEEKKRRLEKQIKPTLPENGAKLTTEKKKRRQQVILIACGAVVFLLLLCVFLYDRFFSYSYMMYRAGRAAQREDYETAIHDYEIASTKGDPITPLINIAKQEYLRGNYDSAIRYLEDLIAMYPDDPQITDAYKQLLNFYGATGNYEKMRQLSENAPNEEVAQLFSSYVLDTVVFSVSGGTYHDDVELTLSTMSTEKHRIYYTIDGTDPDKDKGMLYEEPLLLIDGTTVVKAVCIDENGRKGELKEQSYTIKYRPPDKPLASPRGGTFLQKTMLTLTAADDTTIYYTWNGKIPNSGSAKYEEPITIPEGNNILSAIVVDKHGLTSDILRLNYEYLPRVDGPQSVETEGDGSGSSGGSGASGSTSGGSGASGSGSTGGSGSSGSASGGNGSSGGTSGGSGSTGGSGSSGSTSGNTGGSEGGTGEHGAAESAGSGESQP